METVRSARKRPSYIYRYDKRTALCVQRTNNSDKERLMGGFPEYVIAICGISKSKLSKSIGRYNRNYYETIDEAQAALDAIAEDLDLNFFIVR